MSVSPAQNFSKPPPVPEVPTVTFDVRVLRIELSAIASVSGPTVLEPSTRMSPGEAAAAAAASVVIVVIAAGGDAEREDADAARTNHTFLAF